MRCNEYGVGMTRNEQMQYREWGSAASVRVANEPFAGGVAARSITKRCNEVGRVA